MMQFGDTKVPFYLSTGKGGKANVPAGKWYPFFGFDMANGWFIKASGMEDYYGDDRLKAAAEYLDKKFGDRRERNDWGKKIDGSQERFNARLAINKEINPDNYGVRDFQTDRSIYDLLIEPLRQRIKVKK